jgi:hypothetical protein
LCEIERFGHPLAIAFTLSALFYYVEMRKVANDRIRKVMEIHRVALNNNRQKLSNIVTGGSDASLSKTIVDITRIIRQKRSRERFLAEDLSVFLLLEMTVLLWFFRYSIARINISVHIFAWTSTIVSLGALIYAGYIDGKLNCGIMTLILIISFYSVVWNIWIYFGYIPAIEWLIRYFDALFSRIS